MIALTPELKTAANEPCNEHLEMQEKSLASLKVWLKKNSFLKSRSNDEFLLAFLRCCHYSLEDTKKRIAGFYSMKSIFPEVLLNRNLNDTLMDLYRQGIHTILLKPLGANGPRIIVSQYSKHDHQKTKAGEALKLLFILLEILINEDPKASMAGIVCVIDARDATMEQVRQYDQYLLKNTWTLVEQCLPIQFREIHVINMRKEAQIEFSFVKSILPAKMEIKCVVHQKAEDLYKHLPRDYLTIEYGGHNGYQREALTHWEKVMLKYLNYFAEDDKYGSNEKFRSETKTSPECSELTGLRGSFRKLDVN